MDALTAEAANLDYLQKSIVHIRKSFAKSKKMQDARCKPYEAAAEAFIKEIFKVDARPNADASREDGIQTSGNNDVARANADVSLGDVANPDGNKVDAPSNDDGSLDNVIQTDPNVDTDGRIPPVGSPEKVPSQKGSPLPKNSGSKKTLSDDDRPVDADIETSEALHRQPSGQAAGSTADESSAVTDADIDEPNADETIVPAGSNKDVHPCKEISASCDAGIAEGHFGNDAEEVPSQKVDEAKNDPSLDVPADDSIVKPSFSSVEGKNS